MSMIDAIRAQERVHEFIAEKTKEGKKYADMGAKGKKNLTKEERQAIADYAAKHPEKSLVEMALDLNQSHSTIHKYCGRPVKRRVGAYEKITG